MTHEPVLVVVGARDASPFLSIEARCTCGVLLARHDIDLRHVADTARLGAEFATADAQAFATHCEGSPDAQR